jgi:tetratricopeptide (TPR) repeat protein
MGRAPQLSVLVPLAAVVLGLGHTPYWTGNDRFNKGDYRGAIEAYSKAIAADPMNFAAWFHRAASHDFLKEYDLAIADFDRAVRIVPGFSKAFHYRAHVYSKLDSLDRAIADYDSALATAGEMTIDSQGVPMMVDKSAVYYDRANAYFRLHNYSVAVASYDSAITLSPKFSAAYNNRGHTRIHLADSTGGCVDIQKACELGDKQSCTWVRDHCGKN